MNAFMSLALISYATILKSYGWIKMYSYDLAPPDLELLDQINPLTRKPQLAELEKGHEYQMQI